MPLNDVQIKAMEMIQADPEAFRVLQEQIHKLDPEGKKIPKTALPDIALQSRVDEIVKPWREKTEKLEEQLQKKQASDEHTAQRDFMRRNYKMNDKQIDDLTEWMEKDGAGNIYKNYEAAHLYRQAMLQPIIPNGQPSPNRVSGITGRPVRNTQDEPWREDIAKRRRESGSTRTQDRTKAREEWQKTIAEIRTKG
jgi:hypothetical protein